MSISKIKLADNTVYEIIPHKLTDSTYTVTLPTLTADSTFALSSDLSSYLPLTGGTLTGDLSFSYGKGINNVYSISCYELSAQELNSPLIKNVSALTFGNTNYQFKLPYSGSSILELACNSTSNNVLSVKHNDDDTAHTIEFATTTSLSDGTNSVTIADIANKQDKLVSGTNIKTVNGNSLLGYGDVTILNTTYTLTADTTNNKITLTPSTGTAQSVTVPFATTATNLTNTPSLLTSGNTIAVKAGEKTSSYITVPFATKAASLSDGTKSVTIANIQKKTDVVSWSKVTNDIDSYPSFDYNLRDSLCPLDALYQEDSKADRVAYLNPSCVTIQYSTDGGTTWTDSGYGDASKRLLFGHKGETYINVGRSSASESITLTEDNKANYQTRIIINGLNDNRYCKIQSCYLYMTCPNTISVQLKYTTYGAQDTEVLWRDWTQLGGWSGPNKFPLVSKRAWGSNNSNHIYNLILYFKITGKITQPTNPGTIGDIRFYGDSAWGSKAKVDSPYHKDEYGNIYPRNGFQKVSSLGTSSSFWNNIYGVTLYENGTSLSNKYQTKLSTSQLSAANSGITSTKVSTYDGYSTTISNKADKTAAVNSLSVSGTTLSYKDVNGTQLGSVTLPSSTDTKNTAGSSNSTSKLFLVGTTSQSSTGVQSYSNSSVYTEAGQLYTKSLIVSENASIGTELDVIGLIAVTDSGVQVNDDNNNYTGTDNFSSADIDTTYYSKGMRISNEDSGAEFNLSYPAKSGTLATTSDIPTYSYDSSTGTLSITTNS